MKTKCNRNATPSEMPACSSIFVSYRVKSNRHMASWACFLPGQKWMLRAIRNSQRIWNLYYLPSPFGLIYGWMTQSNASWVSTIVGYKPMHLYTTSRVPIRCTNNRSQYRWSTVYEHQKQSLPSDKKSKGWDQVLKYWWRNKNVTSHSCYSTTPKYCSSARKTLF